MNILRSPEVSLAVSVIASVTSGYYTYRVNNEVRTETKQLVEDHNKILDEFQRLARAHAHLKQELSTATNQLSNRMEENDKLMKSIVDNTVQLSSQVGFTPSVAQTPTYRSSRRRSRSRSRRRRSERSPSPVRKSRRSSSRSSRKVSTRSSTRSSRKKSRDIEPEKTSRRLRRDVSPIRSKRSVRSSRRSVPDKSSSRRKKSRRSPSPIDSYSSSSEESSMSDSLSGSYDSDSDHSYDSYGSDHSDLALDLS